MKKQFNITLEESTKKALLDLKSQLSVEKFVNYSWDFFMMKLVYVFKAHIFNEKEKEEALRFQAEEIFKALEDKNGVDFLCLNDDTYYSYETLKEYKKVKERFLK